VICGRLKDLEPVFGRLLPGYLQSVLREPAKAPNLHVMLVPCLHVRTRGVSCLPAWFTIMGWLVVCPGHDVAIGADASSPDQLLLEDFRPRSIFKLPLSAVERARFPVIDMHSHAYARTEAEVDRWVRTMDAAGIEMTIVAGRGAEEAVRR